MRRQTTFQLHKLGLGITTIHFRHKVTCCCYIFHLVVTFHLGEDSPSCPEQVQCFPHVYSSNILHTHLIPHPTDGVKKNRKNKTILNSMMTAAKNLPPYPHIRYESWCYSLVKMHSQVIRLTKAKSQLQITFAVYISCCHFRKSENCRCFYFDSYRFELS